MTTYTDTADISEAIAADLPVTDYPRADECPRCGVTVRHDGSSTAWREHAMVCGLDSIRITCSL
jgi:hypothetical protein